jgi:hypothetical protein
MRNRRHVVLDRRFLLPLCAAVAEGDKTGDLIRSSQDA